MRLLSATGAQAATLVVAATTGVLIAVTAGGSAAPGVHYVTTPVEPATVTDTISATGTVAARATLDLAFGAANQPVTGVHVHIGQHVRAGQLLATVADGAARAQLAAAQAAVTEASTAATATSPTTATSAPTGTTPGKTTSAGSTTVCHTTTVTVSSPAPSPTPAASTAPSPVPTATASTAPVSPTAPIAGPTRPVRPSSPAGSAIGSGLPRTTRSCVTTKYRPATGTGAASSHAGGNASGGGSSLSSAEQQLATAQAALAATQLEAPQAGVVTTVNASIGTLPGTPAVELRTTGMNVQVPVQEQDAPYVRSGQAVTITFAALGVTGAGTVSADALEPATPSATAEGASRVGGTAGAVVSYPVTVTIANAPPGLLPGMSATVNWVATSRNNVLAVPTSALQGSDAGTVVRILVDGQPRTIPVGIGLSTSSLSQITGGLNAGEQVITGTSAS